MAKKILFDFDKKNGGSATKEALRLFTKAGETPTDSQVDEKVTRRNGVSYKEVKFSFEDGQLVTFQVRVQGGDIFAVKLNGRDLPITNQDDHAAALQEVIAALTKNKKSFAKKREKIKIELPQKMKTSRQKQEVVLAQKIAEVDAQTVEAQAEYDALTKQIEEKKTLLNGGGSLGISGSARK